jgi:hypothetical protein
MTDKKDQKAQEEDFVQFGDGPKIFVSDMSDEAKLFFNERKLLVENKENFVAQANAELRKIDFTIIGCEVSLKQLLETEPEIDAEVVEVEDESS